MLLRRLHHDVYICIRVFDLGLALVLVSFLFFFWHFVLDAFPTYYFDGEYPFCSIVFA